MVHLQMLTVLIALLFASISYADSGIRGVDFHNFTYHPAGCYKNFSTEGMGKVAKVHNGEFKKGNMTYTVDEKILYGHLTGDQTEQAVVNAWCYLDGANYIFPEIFVYTMQNGKVTLISHLDQEDMQRDYARYEPDGALWMSGAEAISGGKLVIEGPADGPHCCPESIITLEYRLNGNNLVLDKRPQKRPFKN